jgi:hypothetical protein
VEHLFFASLSLNFSKYLDVFQLSPSFPLIKFEKRMKITILIAIIQLNLLFLYSQISAVSIYYEHINVTSNNPDIIEVLKVEYKRRLFNLTFVIKKPLNILVTDFC